MRPTASLADRLQADESKLRDGFIL